MPVHRNIEPWGSRVPAILLLHGSHFDNFWFFTNPTEIGTWSQFDSLGTIRVWQPRQPTEWGCLFHCRSGNRIPVSFPYRIFPTIKGEWGRSGMDEDVRNFTIGSESSRPRLTLFCLILRCRRVSVVRVGSPRDLCFSRVTTEPNTR